MSRFSNLPRSRPYELDLPGAGMFVFSSEKVNKVRNTSSHLGIKFTIVINEPKWPKNQPFTTHTQLFGRRLDNGGF